MASNVITFLTVTALACLATVSGSGLVPLPTDIFCTTSDNSACTRYSNSVCYHNEEVCKYGGNCECVTGYAPYSFYNPVSSSTEYSCRPATVPVGGLCSIPLGNTCSGYRTSCSNYNETYGVCVCKNNYKPNSDRTDCIPLSLDQACTGNSIECGVNAYCGSQSRCRCYPGYKPFNSTDCIHYLPGETCPVTECQVTSSGPSCVYGTCKNGVFECIRGSRWWQYSTPNGEQPSPLVDGMCLKNTVSLVSTGELCDSGASEYACRSNHCFTCPEQYGTYVCNGATSSKTISAATSLILLLACYLFH